MMYFAYGANLNQAAMRHRCPAAVALRPFYLQDYRLTFSGVATIQPALGQQVPGALWNITDACEQALDQFEGYPSLYRKQYITVDHMTIMFYRMNSEEPWEPSQGYLDTIAQGYRDFGLDLADLDMAVRETQREAYEHDLQSLQYPTHHDHGEHDPAMAVDVYHESGHDLRWLRHGWRS